MSTAAMRTDGQVVGGQFGDVIVRQKAGTVLEIGDMLVSDEEGGSILISQVFSLQYGSQIQEGMRQMMSGVDMEQPELAGAGGAQFYEPGFVNYVLARTKPLARVAGDGSAVSNPKALPGFFNNLRLISKDDLGFLDGGGGDILVGHIRSGTKVIREAAVRLPAEDVFSHHVLIPATTGRGKSNLVKTMMWHVLGSGNRVGALVLDAHDEYYGRHETGLKDHPEARRNLAYYTPADPPPGAHRLTINLRQIMPEHFEGIVDLSAAQLDAIRLCRITYGEEWIARVMTEMLESLSMEGAEAGGGRSGISRSTLSVVRRKLRLMLGLTTDEEGNIISRHAVFDATTHGMGTVKTIVEQIGQGRVVVLDTSRLSNEAELLVGNIIATRLFEDYKVAKATGDLGRRPVAAVVIEEAPRVIGSDVLVSGNENIYATIAKEGRKFRVGLVAITQLSSVIPKAILANMNTKIILGNEMKQERDALIASASQDLSADDRNIASLDKGEAIITSIFVPFAMPIKIPEFKEMAREAIAGSGERRERVLPPGATGVKMF